MDNSIISPAPEGAGEKSPEELAAEQALARAATPPTSVGGPGVPATPGDVIPPAEPAPAAAEPEAERDNYATRLAAQRANGDAIVAVEDGGYTDARDAVLAGSKDEADLEEVTEWLLSDTSDANSRKLTVVAGGSDAKPILVDWYVTAIGIDIIRSAEREASGAAQGRQARRGQPTYDELAANLRVVAEATYCIVPKGQPADPEFSAKKLAAKLGLRDPTTWLQAKFRFKPGLIAQVAGEVMALSGFDQADVQAAGN